MPFTNPFPPATHADWLAQVQVETQNLASLQDTDAYETLRWPSPEGFTVEPYYTAGQSGYVPDGSAAQRNVPGWTQPGCVQAGWLNAPAYTVSDAKTDNARLREALTNGADALTINVAADVNVPALLNGIKLSDTPVFFTVEGDPTAFLTALRQVAPYQLRGGISVEPTYQQAALYATADSPQFRALTVDGTTYHNAGGTATQELAFTLAQLADQFDRLTDVGFAPNLLAQKTVIRIAIGTSYFTEIAKLRALRVLLQRFNAAYGVAQAPMYMVHATTSPFYEATATPYTNLLRATTGAMAAVIGGCDVLTVRPYDAVLGSTTAFSERIARNVSVLLREEGHFDKVADPAAGSYYIETLTNQLVENAWTLFLDVEKQGGLANAAGYVQAELDKAYQAKVDAVQQGRVLVGVTKFRHDEGGAQSGTFVSIGGSKRLAERFE